jgi:colanic acid/amylovoran biosynthesis glycosyltransferase
VRIATIANRFPRVSETFVVDQVTGLLDLGHDVDVYPVGRHGNSAHHPAIDARGLWPRIHPLSTRQAETNNSRSRLGLLHPRRVARLPRSPRDASLFIASRRAGVDPLTLARGDHLVTNGPYDVVYCHFGPNGLRGMLLRDRYRLKAGLVTVFHGYDITSHVDRNGAKVYKRLFEQGDLFLPVSHRWKDRLLELGCDEDKIQVHRMGIDLARFPYKQRRGPIEGDTERPLRLLSIARLVEKKGIAYAIEAVHRLKKAGHRVEYTVIGDGPLRAGLEDQVRRLGLRSHVRLVGGQDDQAVKKMVYDADLLLAPSVTASTGDQEGLPVVLMEAGASGLPVVSTWHSGIPELIENGTTGILVEERDSQAIAQAVARLHADHGLRRRLAENARKKVEKQHDNKKLAARTEHPLETASSAQ